MYFDGKRRMIWNWVVRSYQNTHLLLHVRFCWTDLVEHVHNVWSSQWLIEQIIGCHFCLPIKCVMRISFSASFLYWHISVPCLFVCKGHPVNIHPTCVFTNSENSTRSHCDSDVDLYAPWTATHFEIWISIHPFFTLASSNLVFIKILFTYCNNFVFYTGNAWDQIRIWQVNNSHILWAKVTNVIKFLSNDLQYIYL